MERTVDSTTDLEIPLVVEAEDDNPMKSHIVCGTCYPEYPPIMGTPSICGEKILGVAPQPGDKRCKKCTEEKVKHAILHVIGKR